MFTEALFTVIQNWKENGGPPTEEWINNLWYVHKMRYDSAVTMNKSSIW